MKNLLEAGVHFGHQTRRWNPKMKKYIFTARNGIHIINLQKTIGLAKTAYETMREFAAQGGKILFVGTKKQAQNEIEKAAQSCGMYYVNNRWLGGLLTNFNTVRKSIQRLRKLEEVFDTNTVNEIVKTKKEALLLRREHDRLKRYLNGIKDMAGLPDALFVIDPAREHIAIEEARRLNIPIFALVDTNCDPDLVDYPIPANDDAIRAVALFLEIMVSAIEEGKQGGEFSQVEIDEGDDSENDSENSAFVSEPTPRTNLEALEELETKYDDTEEVD